MNELGSAGTGTFSSAMAEAAGYSGWIASAFREFVGRTVAEVGFGHDSLRDRLPRGVRYIGVDRDPAIVAAAKVRHPETTFVEADIAADPLPDRLHGLGIDTILCVNVLEHIADDRRAVTNLVQVLPPGGHLLLLVPALQILYNDLDRLAGHVRRYSRRQLAALVTVEPATLRRLEYFNPIGAVGWWANRFVRHRSLETAAVRGQVALFDRYALPVSRLLNPLTRGAFGQSLICVLQKR